MKTMNMKVTPPDLRLERLLNSAEKRIAVLRAQIEDLQLQLHEEEIAYRSKLELIKTLGIERSDPTVNKFKQTYLRPDTDLEKVRQILLKENLPLHVKEIAKRLGKPDTKGAQTSLAGSLNRYVKQRQIFTRPDSNIFGLIEKQGDYDAYDLIG